ncbi:MAG: extracellular solute-binding protein [Bacteroidota bacterium]
MRLAALLCLAALLAGCGADPYEGKTRVRIWHTKDSAERANLERVVAEYNAQHTDRVVEVLWRETEDLRNLFIIASVGGKGPELVYGASDNVSLFAMTETVRPLGDLFSDEFFEQFTEDGVVSWEGDTLMVADQLGAYLTMVVNQDLMPNPPASLDSLIVWGQDFTEDTNGDGRPDRYAITWNYTEPFFFVPFLTAFGGWVMDDDGRPTLDTEATVEAIQFILDLRDKYQIIPNEADYNISEMLFKDNRAAAIINGPWAFAGYGEAGVNYDLVSIPPIEPGARWPAPMVSPRGYSVNANVSDEDLPIVIEVLEYLVSEEMQRIQVDLDVIPTLRRVMESPQVQDNPRLRSALLQVQRGRAMPIAPAMRQVWDGMRGPYQLVMSGDVTAEEGARMMQEQVEKRIADTFL